jgi:predicted metal-dependent phosphoesterase TrpH
VAKADLHIHTRVSDGLASVESTIDHVEHATDLSVVAITDHEDVAGGLRGREYAARMGYTIEVVPGAEITTLHGHLLALFIERAPPSFRSVEATIEAIHAAGGLAVVPHPLSWLTRSLSGRTLLRLGTSLDPGLRLDAIELANPSPAGLRTRNRAIALNRELRLVAVGGSDAHHLAHVGRGWTRFEGRTSDDLRRALLDGAVEPGMTAYPPLRELGAANIALGLAWGYAATPRKIAGKVWRR